MALFMVSSYFSLPHRGLTPPGDELGLVEGTLQSLVRVLQEFGSSLSLPVLFGLATDVVDLFL